MQFWEDKEIMTQLWYDLTSTLQGFEIPIDYMQGPWGSRRECVNMIMTPLWYNLTHTPREIVKSL